MAVSGYATTVSVSGTPVAVVDAPMSLFPGSAYYKYQVADATRRVMDPNAAITVKVDADGAGAGAPGVVSGTTYSVDPLAGTINFTAPLTASAVVTISYSYVPTLPLLGAHEASVSITNEGMDASEFNAGGTRTNVYGLQDAEASVSTWEQLTADMDPGAGTQKLVDVLQQRQTVLVEVNPTGQAAGVRFRMWAVCTSGESASSTAELLSSSLTFKLATRAVFGRTGEYTGVSLT